MRIGIDAITCLPGRTGGVETYVRGLLRGLAAIDSPHLELMVFAQPGTRESFGITASNAQWITPPRGCETLGAAFMVEQITLSTALYCPLVRAISNLQ